MFVVYLQAMEIASERTAEERSNQDKVHEEVHSLSTVQFFFPILTSRVSIVMKKILLFFNCDLQAWNSNRKVVKIKNS